MPDRVRRPVRVFVARTGNAFMGDIASWIAEAVGVEGRHAEIVTDSLPVPDGAVNLVVAPHEFYWLGGHDDAAIRAAARCSIPICTEQPGTSWFRRTLGYCVGSPLVVDINAVGTEAIRREGFRVERLRLGAVPGMDRSHEPSRGDDDARDIDVVFLGGLTSHREVALASLAPVLWDRSCDLRTFPFQRPVVGGEPGLVFGSDKYELLARSKVLVNLHRGAGAGDAGDDRARHDRYFEWARIVEAMANGCVVLTEPSAGHEPLVVGTHFVESDVTDMADALTGLLDDDARRADIARAAHTEVLGPLALSRAVARIVDIAETEQMGLAPAPVNVRQRLGARRFRGRDDVPPLFPVYTPYRTARRAVYDAFVAEVEHRRAIGRLRAEVHHGDEDHVTVDESPAWATAAAEVAAVVTLFDYADTVVETLDSIVASRDVDIEIVVVDDASRDTGPDVVRRWMDDHPTVAARLVSCAANHGLPEARNLGLDHARVDLVMMMDADNLVYPTCLRRLADALGSAPGAAFAYSTLEAFGDTAGLRSAHGWHVPWLCDAPYIDAQALLRRTVVQAHGGYRADPAAYGWEDWDLWLRLAAAGERGVHVAEMLGRYRTHATSMVSLTNLAADGLRAALVERYPDLPWPELA